jgi:flagella basal body P-ring formation protein FlgA
VRKHLGLATERTKIVGWILHLWIPYQVRENIKGLRYDILILLQCVVIGTVSMAVAGDPALTVVLRPLVQVEDGTMTLGNVAEVFGSDIAGAARLGEVTLGRAPALGETRTLTHDDIVRYCLRSGFKKNDFSVTGAEEVVTSRVSDTVTPDALSQVIEGYLSKQLTPRGVRYDWEYSKAPDQVAIPVGAVVEVIPKTGAELQGTVWLQIGVRKEGSLEPAFLIRVDISTYENLWVAKQTIARGTSITKDLIESHEVETTWLVGNPRGQVESIIGYRAKRTISAGRVITSDMIDIPYAVRRGDLVTINAYGEGVVASVDGQARQDGRPGDWIWVVNLLTRSKIKAQVVDGKSVVIP